MKTKLKNSNKIISIVLALVMLLGMLPMVAYAAQEAPDLGKGSEFIAYSDGVTQYIKYENYLYKITYTNIKNVQNIRFIIEYNYLRIKIASTSMVELKASDGSTRLKKDKLPKTADAVLNCYCDFADITVNKSKPVLIITCLAVSEPVWNWNGNKATAVFTSTDGNAKMTVDASVTSVEVPADCLNQGKITYTATATCNGQNYTDTYTVYGDVKPHDWSNLDGVCANGCGTVCGHENRTDDVCDVCGYECLHEETYETVTKLEHFSVQNSDGTWTKATISVVCRECESVIEYKEADRADYTEFDKAMARVTELLESGDLTEDKYNHYNSVIGSFKTDSYQGSPFQEAADSYADSLEHIVNEIEAGLADGTMKKADWTYMTALLEEVNTLIDNDANNIVPKVIGYYYSPRGFYNGSVNNPNYSQAAYNEAIANYDLENMLETLIAGLKDGTMLKADYTAIDEAIAELNEKLADENLTDEAKAGLEEIKAELEKLRRNTYASKADLAVLEKALEDYETELDAGIADGTAVKVNGLEEIVKINDALNNELAEKYGEEALAEIAEKVDEKFADKFDELYERAEALTGSVAENKDALAEIEAEMEAIFAEAENCLNGTHNGLKFEITEEAKCGENAIESATCTLCGETVTREVENSALKHSFTKYEETEAPKCGVAGKEVAYCDNGCGETDEKSIEALRHSFTEYVYNEDATCTENGTKTAVCDNGCGETDTVTAEDTMLDHADADGDYKCDFGCGTEIKNVCPDCGEAIHENKLGEYICMLKTIIKTVVDIIALLKTITSVFA